MAPEAPRGFAANHRKHSYHHLGNSPLGQQFSSNKSLLTPDHEATAPTAAPHLPLLSQVLSSPTPLTKMDRAEHTPRAHQALRAPSPIDSTAQQAAGATPRHGAPRTAPVPRQSAYIIRKEHQR